MKIPIMKRIFYFFLLLSFNNCFSQFGIINDVDGFVNIRNSVEKRFNIKDTLKNGFVVYNYGPEGNWINIDYKKNGEQLNGYIYKDRIKYVSDYTEIPLKTVLDGKAILENGTVKVEITEDKFVEKSHKLEFLKDYKNILVKIDNSQIFGTDGNIPKNEYKSIKIEINNLIIELPKAALHNLYEPNLYNSKVYYDQKNDILYISSLNGDGAGGYDTIWIIEKKHYKCRFEAYAF